MSRETWYYYLHTNGDLIGKNPVSVEHEGPASYFEGPFVRRWWHIDLTDRKDAWTLAVEALALGARIDRVKELAERWGLTRADLKNYIAHLQEPSELQKDGMDKFIREVLGLEPDEVWDSILAEEAEQKKESV